MATLINKLELEKIVAKVLEEDMNECLEKVTAKVVSELHDTVKANVAARMIALCRTDYDMRYMRDELSIRVQFNTGNNKPSILGGDKQ